MHICMNTATAPTKPILLLTMKNLLVLFITLTINLSARSQTIPAWKIADLNNYIDTCSKELIVINLWATFCGPCVHEIPDFIRVAKSKDNVALLLLSVDGKSEYPKKLNRFVRKKSFHRVPNAWLDEDNADYFISAIAQEWTGSIPATLFIHKPSGRKEFVESELDKATLETILHDLETEKVWIKPSGL